MPRKLAIVISGAVSLGSYEAGVMYEVIEAISIHNKNLAENDERRLEIDVITGASAGGMTACILVQHLLCDDGLLSDPYNNPLYKAWVKEADISTLLPVPPENQKYSLLNFSVIDDIANAHLPDKPKAPNKIHPAASSEIQVGVAMSNLNGFTYEISDNNTNHDTTELSYSRYKDQFVCVARRLETGDVLLMEKALEEEDGKNNWRKEFREINWSELREIGISSGAFPFAFRARPIHRVGAGKFLKRDSEQRKKKGAIKREGKFLYTDGGVFENEPIGMAKSLVDQTEQNSDSPDRYYLFVAPGKREITKDPFLNRDDDLLTTGIALLSAIFGQARFQDWITDEMKSPVYSITATDTDLIGDVFSAFSGFLEEKFRAYDYNIGRENAQKKLQEAGIKGLLTYAPVKMPPIEWKVPGKEGQIGGRPVQSWQDAKTQLSKLAKVIINAQGEREQLKELQGLMHEVDKETRKEMFKQLTSRLDYLIDFINDDYLKPLDEINDGSPLSKLGSWFKITIRTWVGRPITKFVLWLFLRTWLETNILNPPPQTKRI